MNQDVKQEVQAAGNMQHSNSEVLTFSPSAKSSTADFQGAADLIAANLQL